MNPLVYAIAYAAILLTAGLAVFWSKYRLREARAPFPEESRLLRGPGESLSVQLAALDEEIVRLLLGILLLPAIGLGASILINWILEGALGLAGGGGALSVCLLFTFNFAQRVVRLLDRRRNTRLGLFGERIVAEHLEQLKANGHRVFHDLPAEDPRPNSHKPLFNIDHIVVGPAGVFAIETKTRRKGRARVGFMAHEIIYDGRALAYPWGEDQHGLAQAKRQADWLAELLQRELGRPVPVHALLVFPGWSIIRKDAAATNPVTVLSPRELPAAIERPAPSGHTGFAVPPLDPAAIDLVCRQLESRCRDVEL